MIFLTSLIGRTYRLIWYDPILIFLQSFGPRHPQVRILHRLRIRVKTAQKQFIKCHFELGSVPLWAWVCAVLDCQDKIKELFKCVLRFFGNTKGSPLWTTAEVEAVPA